MNPYDPIDLRVGDRTFRLVINRAGNIAFAVVDERSGKAEGNLLSPEHAEKLAINLGIAATTARERIQEYERQQVSRPKRRSKSNAKRGTRRNRNNSR